MTLGLTWLAMDMQDYLIILMTLTILICLQKCKILLNNFRVAGRLGLRLEY